MELKLQISNGSADGLITYLENFARFRQTLLLEVDPLNKCFVAKGLLENSSAIRYSSMPFEAANINVVSDSGNSDQRIRVGILNTLDKLIKIIRRFDTYLKQDKENVVYMNIKYDNALDNDKNDVLAAISITFKTKELTMKFDCFKVTEFRYLADSVFLEHIFHVTNETRFSITPEMVKNIISTSEIFSKKPTEDVIFFDIENSTVSVMDKLQSTNNDGELIGEPTYILTIANLDTSANQVNIPILRDTFIKMFGKTDENYDVIIGYYMASDGSTSIDRILFESQETKTKVVISKTII